MTRSGLLLAVAILAPVVANHAAAEDLESLEQAAFQAAVERVAPSVVRIETVGGRDRLGKTLLGAGPTTGLIVDKDGLIVSSEFSFLRQPDSILVQLPDGARKPAKLVATDHSRMLVLLKIEPDAPLPVPEFAKRDTMRVGQWTIAVGRTFQADRVNLAVGILSAISRIRGRAIQTDATASPNNYGGPLLDIHGRVLGILTPLSPKPNEEVGRLEWYDAGIGFAAPADDLLRALPRLREGKDLHAGLLGVSFKHPDPNTAEPIIAACHPKSPGYEVLKPKDRIRAINGRRIERVAELEDALGPFYAGDKVTVTVERAGKTQDRELTLVAELPPYKRPFLGILPLRAPSTAAKPVTVRFVYPNSPAAKADIKAGDILLSMAGQKLADADDLRRRVATLLPEDEVTLKVRRDGKTRTVKAKLQSLPEALPDASLPPSGAVKIKSTGEGRGKVKIDVPEIKNEAWAYVPEGYDAAVPHGVVVWLDAPGAMTDENILKLWKPICSQRNLILLTVKPVGDSWLPNEEEVVARVLEEVVNGYTIDPHRIVTHGYQGGGVLASLAAFRHRDLVRAVAAVDAPLSTHPPTAEPIYPLAFYLVTAEKSGLAVRIKRSVMALKKGNFSIEMQSIGEMPRYLLPDEVQRLGKWIDTLDRI